MRAKPLPERVAKAVGWMVRHPAALTRFASAMEAHDGRSVARLLEGDVKRQAGAHLMVDGDIHDVTFTRLGTTWRTDFSSSIGECLWRFGGFAVHEINALAAWLRMEGRQGAVVDVGANIGTTSVPFAQSGYRVVAIEPVPKNFELLLSNIRTNSLEHSITAVNCAIGPEPGEVQMWTGFGSGGDVVAFETGRSIRGCHGNGPAEPLETWGGRASLVTVASKPLDQVLAESSVPAAEVAAVWADVQGYETQVITTGTDLWKAGVPLFAEVCPKLLDMHGELDVFYDAATSWFPRFLSSDDLLAGREPRPITQLRPWATALGMTGGHSDALLLPSRGERGNSPAAEPGPSTGTPLRPATTTTSNRPTRPEPGR